MFLIGWQVPMAHTHTHTAYKPFNIMFVIVVLKTHCRTCKQKNNNNTKKRFVHLKLNQHRLRQVLLNESSIWNLDLLKELHKPIETDYPPPLTTCIWTQYLQVNCCVSFQLISNKKATRKKNRKSLNT